MLLLEDSFQAPVITPAAPTAASTGSALSRASSGLENLLNLAVNGYASVMNAKATVQQTKTDIANANRTGVPTQPVTDGSALINPKVLIYGAAALGALVVGVALLRRK